MVNDGNYFYRWDALTNPFSGEPCRSVRAELSSRVPPPWRLRWLWWKLHIGTYRLIYWTLRKGRGFIRNAFATPKRTLWDAAVNLPIALLVLPPYREFVFAWKPAAWKLSWSPAGISFGALILARVFLSARRKHDYGEELLLEVGESFTRLDVILASTRAAKGTTPVTPEVLKLNVTNALKAIADLAHTALSLEDAKIEIRANLMVPMKVLVNGSQDAVQGCGIVCYGQLPPSPSWTRLAAGDFGAGATLEGKGVQVVEDTEDPIWCGVFNSSRSKCFASFPVIDSSSNRTIAIVNIDSTEPMFITRRSAAAVYSQVLALPLSMLADMLIAANQADTEDAEDDED